MGLALDPAFEDNRRLYSCQGVTGDGGASISVIAWSVADDWSRATRTDDPLIGDIPVNEASGRHGGCRLRFAPDGALLIGTGDNALGTNPQDPRVAGRQGAAGRSGHRRRRRLDPRAPQRAGPGGAPRDRAGVLRRARPRPGTTR